MVEGFEHLMLEHLTGFQAIADRLEIRLDEMAERATNMEALMARAVAHLEEIRAAKIAWTLRADEISLSLDRIERRLDLTS